MQRYDVAIVGGGPAGSTCARLLAASGLTVVVLEKAGRDHSKTCAGGISFPAYELAPIPGNVVERRITASRVIAASGRSVTVGNPAEPGYTVCRGSYDLWLMSEAEKAGAMIATETMVDAVAIGANNVLVKTRRQGRKDDVSCSVVVGAFGCSSGLHRFFGLTRPEYVIGLCCELSLPESTVDERIGDTIEIYFDTAYADLGYSWIFPKKNGVNAGIVSSASCKDKASRLRNFLAHHPAASRKLDGAAPAPVNGRPVSAAMIPVRPLNKTYGRRFVLIGDAAGLADPLTYEGIGYALESASLAAEAIVSAFRRDDMSENALSSYQEKWLARIHADNISYARKIAGIVHGHELSNVLGNILVDLALEDAEVSKALGYLLNRKEPRRRVYEILMSRKLKLLKTLGLAKSLRLLPRLIGQVAGC